MMIFLNPNCLNSINFLLLRFKVTDIQVKIMKFSEIRKKENGILKEVRTIRKSDTRVKSSMRLIFSGLLFMGCSQQRQVDSKDALILKREEAKDVQFSYRLQADSLFEKATLGRCQIKNTGSDTIYYLATSCNGLSPFCQLDKTKFYIVHEIDCNKSWDVIQILPPKQVYAFDVHIKSIHKNGKVDSLGLNLICVDKFVTREKLKLFNEEKQTSLVRDLAVKNSRVVIE